MIPDDIRTAEPVHPTAPVFLVLEKDMLIATDISDALRAHGPCRVVHVDDPAHLDAALDTEARFAVAILEMRYKEVLDTGLAESLSNRGARIVLTIGEGDKQDVLSHGWSMLTRPFTDEMIRELLPPVETAH